MKKINFIIPLPLSDKECPNFGGLEGCSAYKYLKNEQNIFKLTLNSGKNATVTPGGEYDFETFIHVCKDLRQLCKQCAIDNYYPR